MHHSISILEKVLCACTVYVPGNKILQNHTQNVTITSDATRSYVKCLLTH